MRIARLLKSRAAGIGRVCVLLIGLSAPLFAQRTYTVSTSVDVIGGFESYPQTSGLPVQPTEAPVDPFYGVLPGITLESRTARSEFSLNYGFGFTHYATELPRDTRTHNVHASISRRLSSRWTMDISEWFSQTNDLFSYYALLGAELVDDGLVFYFSPVATNQSVRTNNLSASFNHDLSARSTLSFNGGWTLGGYGNAGNLVGLSDQNSFSGGVEYSRRISERLSWNLGYSGQYFTYDKFGSAVSNAVHFGLESVIAKGTKVSVSVGPSQVKNLNVDIDNTNFQASGSVTKEIKGNSFHFTLAQGNATSSGVGTISSTRSASAGVARTFGRRVSVFADASVFEGLGIIGNPFNTKGTSITGNVGIAIARNVSVHTGVQFQKYTQPSPYAFTQKRVFASVRYTQPNLFRSR
ncbi:MAG TPA: hypothetical protein VFR18_02125 [Terriglobia bacterium]|nr:hypothetical protein [Terriglobia bacterium]